MKERGGKIINIGSTWAVKGAPGWSDYHGCKKAIKAFSRSAAMEWGKYNINVNTVCPALDSPPNVQSLSRSKATIPAGSCGLKTLLLLFQHPKIQWASGAMQRRVIAQLQPILPARNLVI